MAERAFVALDLETTGLNSKIDTIIEIGAVRIEGDRITDRFSTLVNPDRAIPLGVQQLTGIRNEDVANAPFLETVLPELLSFVRADVVGMVAHNAGFDLGFLRAAGVNFHRPALDTFDLATMLLPGMASYNLGELSRALGIRLDDAHRALADATATGYLFMELRARMQDLPTATLQTLFNAGQESGWAPLLLIEEALEQRDPMPAPARTDLRERSPLTPRFAPVPETLVKDGGPPPTPVPPATLADYFGAGGRLAADLGARYEERAGQIDMAEQVLTAFNDGQHLLVEAGTGVGKSLAYLLPAALWSVQNQRRVVIATNTIALQDQLIDNDIPQLRTLMAASGDGDLNASLLKGRGNYLCLRRLYEWLSNRQLSPLELNLLAKVLVWLPNTQTGDVNEMFLPSPAERAIWARICSDHATCHPGRCGGHPSTRDFYLEARQQAEHAHLLVVNHALLLADLAAENQTLPPYQHLIIDEAHHLEEVTTDQLTFAVVWSDVTDLLARVAPDGDLLAALTRLAPSDRDPTTHEALRTLATSAHRSIHEIERFAQQLTNFAAAQTNAQNNSRGGSRYAQRLALDSRMRSQPQWSEIEIDWDQTVAPLNATNQQLHDLTARLVKQQWDKQEPESTYLDELQGVAARLGELVGHVEIIIMQPQAAEHNVVTWLEYGDTDRNDQVLDARLYSAPLYVGKLIADALVNPRRSVVLTGATLRTGADFRYIRERLGLWGMTATTVASPFDYERSTLLYLPTDLPAPHQAQYQRAVEQSIVSAARAAGGRTLVLFTSFAQLRTTAETIRPILKQDNISILQHGTSSRYRLLREFRASERAVLLGTRSFWEGIDLPGDQLSVLVIVRLPFAVPSDPLVAARSAEFENGFMEYTVPDAILRFRQGFGRLIRRATDRGVVVLLDSRIWQKRYGQSFLDALPPCRQRRAPLANLDSEIDLWLNQE